MNLNILYEDADLIVCVKPAGIASQDERGFQPALTDWIKQHLAKQSGKKGEPYLGVIHRLDKPVGGVMLYAKSKKASAALSAQIAAHQIKKQYYAILSQMPNKPAAELTDYLIQDKKKNCSFVGNPGCPNAKKAVLSYRIVEQISLKEKKLVLADILLKTGRHHQIRVQFAHLGCPLYGDLKYNPDFDRDVLDGELDGIGLYAYCLEFLHPDTKKTMRFLSMPATGIWKRFSFIQNGQSNKKLPH